MKYWLAFILALVIGFLATWAGKADAYVSPTAQARLEAIASSYTGESTTLVCQKKFPKWAKDATGYVLRRTEPHSFGFYPIIHLRQFICDSLAQMVIKHRPGYWFPANTQRCNQTGTSCWTGTFSGWDAAIDLMVFTHEATHIKTGSDNECAVNMTALGNLWETDRFLMLPTWAKQSILDQAPGVVRHSPTDYQPGPGQPFDVSGCFNG